MRVSAEGKSEGNERTRSANVIPASNAPKNTQKPMKNRMHSLRGFLCA